MTGEDEDEESGERPFESLKERRKEDSRKKRSGKLRGSRALGGWKDNSGR